MPTIGLRVMAFFRTLRYDTSTAPGLKVSLMTAKQRPARRFEVFK